MKFTCDSCSAQYMISDDKVGPSGVKVRCKKCGHVILVRRVAGAPAADDTKPSVAARAAGPSPSTNGATHPGVDAQVGAPAEGAPPGAARTPAPGLDAELGSAFDHAFGDAPPEAARPKPQAELGATQAMGAEDAAKVLAQSAPAQTEWYVAIGQAQVGPLPLVEVKRKWEGGDVGPDSLVWRPGMADWAPLTTVSELAGFLAPVSRAASPAATRPAAEARRVEQAPAAAEASWKPAGASALAALATEELASRAPAARPAPARPVKSLVDTLPEGGGVDPTGALPIAIKGLETTGAKKIERRSSVARGAEKVRNRRSATRALAAGIAVGVLVVAGAGAAAVYLGWVRPSRLQAPAPIASIPVPPPPAVAPAATAPVPSPPPPSPPAPQPAVAAAAPAPATSARVAAPEPKRPPEPKHVAAEPRPERHPTRRAEPPPRPPQTVAAAPRPPQTVAAAPAPVPKPTKKGGDSILDFESGGNDSALDDALGGGSPASGKRSVYVPPARAGGVTLPDKVSPGEINGAVAQRIDALRRCVSEQKAREPDLTGTLKMRWVIQGDGSVREVKCLTPEYAQGQFAACLGGVVKSIRFPRSGTTGQEVTFPFNF